GAHVVHAGVGGAVDLHDVHRAPLGDLPARVALAAGVGGRPLGAAQRLGQDARRAGLAHAARAGEQKRVVDALLGDGVGQRARDVLLPDQLVEALGPVLAREDQVRHGGNLLYPAATRAPTSLPRLSAGGWCLPSFPGTGMRLDKLTIKAQEALQAAHDLAEKRNQQEMTPEHLLLALLTQEQGVTGAILRKLGIEPEALATKVERTLDDLPQVRGSRA